jgi:hypothetical protein
MYDMELLNWQVAIGLCIICGEMARHAKDRKGNNVWFFGMLFLMGLMLLTEVGL